MNANDRAAPDRISVGVIGGTGYTGLELLRVLAGHDAVDVRFASSRSRAGEPSPVPALDFVDPEDAPFDDVDLVFLCLPHGTSAPWLARLEGGPRIVDLTADHRPGSGAEDGFAYGLAERNGGEVATAQRVANPGCYPTGVILSLTPLVDAGLVDADRLTVVNAASGVTGAGRTPKTHLLFAEVAGNFRAYGEGNQHRHLREIRALLPSLQLLFQPHLLPVPRGILETVTLPVRDGIDASAVRSAWREAYADSSAVEVLPEGIPDLSMVVGTDRLALGAADVAGVREPVVTVVAALDNLGKGAAGQAVQNMNLMYGWPIARGIRC